MASWKTGGGSKRSCAAKMRGLEIGVEVEMKFLGSEAGGGGGELIMTKEEDGEGKERLLLQRLFVVPSVLFDTVFFPLLSSFVGSSCCFGGVKEERKDEDKLEEEDVGNIFGADGPLIGKSWRRKLDFNNFFFERFYTSLSLSLSLPQGELPSLLDPQKALCLTHTPYKAGQSKSRNPLQLGLRFDDANQTRGR